MARFYWSFTIVSLCYKLQKLLWYKHLGIPDYFLDVLPFSAAWATEHCSLGGGSSGTESILYKDVNDWTGVVSGSPSLSKFVDETSGLCREDSESEGGSLLCVKLEPVKKLIEGGVTLVNMSIDCLQCKQIQVMLQGKKNIIKQFRLILFAKINVVSLIND